MRKPAKPTPKPRNERDDEEPAVFFRIRDARTRRIIASTESEKEADKLVKKLVQQTSIVMEGFELFMYEDETLGSALKVAHIPSPPLPKA